VSSGITARAFVKTASIARASEAAFRDVSESVLALAEHEGFPAHAAAVRVRLAASDPIQGERP
ncbi:MAG: Histidinol dehydrogenase, partial [Gaiellales bacterium]|nr:Histidinol dehydrogenase [Gaiellales bacterium]